MSKLIQALKSLRDLAADQGESELYLSLANQIANLNELLPKALELATAHVANDPEPYARLTALLEADSDEMDKVWVEVEPAEHVDKDDFEDEDRALGTYLYEVPAYLSASQQVAVALDLFHGAVAISNLEDYEITAIKYPDQPVTYVNGSLESLGVDMQ